MIWVGNHHHHGGKTSKNWVEESMYSWKRLCSAKNPLHMFNFSVFCSTSFPHPKLLQMVRKLQRRVVVVVTAGTGRLGLGISGGASQANGAGG